MTEQHTTKNFNHDFDFFTRKITSNDNFAFARYADGEVALMQGREVGQGSQAYHVDNWSAPSRLTKVGEQLLESLNHCESNYYYAISTAADGLSDFEFLSSRIQVHSNITFANLFINANYQKTKAFYTTLTKEVYVICNHVARKNHFPFSVAELFPFPSNCIEYWELYGEDYVSDLIKYVVQVKNKTFFVSCGPVSEVLIHKLFNANPDNQYVDVGSSLDEYIHGTKTRPYMDPQSPYSREVSSFQ